LTRQSTKTQISHLTNKREKTDSPEEAGNLLSESNREKIVEKIDVVRKDKGPRGRGNQTIGCVGWRVGGAKSGDGETDGQIRPATKEETRSGRFTAELGVGAGLTRGTQKKTSRVDALGKGVVGEVTKDLRLELGH